MSSSSSSLSSSCLQSNLSRNILLLSSRDHESFGPDAVSLFSPGVSVERRQSPGASGPLAAKDQKARLMEAIRSAEARLA
mgnify:CR=1 FL=1